MNFTTLLVSLLVSIAFGIVLSLLVGAVFMWLWNWIVPSVFAGPSVTYWQAVGIMFMIEMIGSAFKSSIEKT